LGGGADVWGGTTETGRGNYHHRPAASPVGARLVLVR
jgi:hypothetical protein